MVNTICFYLIFNINLFLVFMSQPLNDNYGPQVGSSSKVGTVKSATKQNPSSKEPLSRRSNRRLPKQEGLVEERIHQSTDANDFTLVQSSRKAHAKRLDFRYLNRAKKDKKRHYRPPSYVDSTRPSPTDKYTTRPTKRTYHNTTWHLPYVKSFVVDRSRKDPDLYIPGVEVDRLPPSERAAVAARSNLSDPSSSGFASDVWEKVPKKAPTPSRSTTFQIRDSVTILYPKHHRFPYGVFPQYKLDEFLRTINVFLSQRQKSPQPSRTLDHALRRINYGATREYRLGMTSSLSSLMHANISSLKRNTPPKKFLEMISSASLFDISLKWENPLHNESYPDAIPAPVSRTHSHSREEKVSPSPIPLRYQSGPPDSGLFDDRPSSDFSKYTPQFLSLLKETSPAVARTISLLYTLYQTKTQRDVWAAILITYINDDAAYYLKDMATAFLEEAFPKNRYQAASDFMENMFTQPVDMFAQTSIARSAWELFGSFSLHGIFSSMGIMSDKHFIGTFLSWVKPMLRHSPNFTVDPLETFLSRLLSFSKLALSKVRECIELGSFKPLFDTTLSVSEWIRWTDFLLYDTTLLHEPANPAGTESFAKKKLAGQLPVFISRQLNKTEWQEQITASRQQGEKMLDSLVSKGEWSLHSAVSRQLLELKHLGINMSLEGVQGSFRVQPFGTMLIGAAGVGKSTLCHELHLAFAHASGHKTDASGLLRVDGVVGFQDGARRGQTTVMFDDIDAKPAPVSASHDDHVTLVNKYINVTPFNIEQAALGDKGKFWAAFTAALYTTNFPDCRLKGYCDYPPMFWRRFPYRIELKAKPEFATAAGAIDYEKVSAAHTKDVQEFHLYVLDPSLMGIGRDYEPPYKLVHVYQSRTQFFAEITRLYLKHFEREKITVKAANADRHLLAHCSLCHLPLEEHEGSLPCVQRQQMCRETVSNGHRVDLCPNGSVFVHVGNDRVEVVYETILFTWFIYLSLAAIFAFTTTLYSLGVTRADFASVVRPFVDEIPYREVSRFVRSSVRTDFTFWIFILPLLVFGPYLFSESVRIVLAAVIGTFLPDCDPYIRAYLRENFYAYELWLWNMLRPPFWALAVQFLSRVQFQRLLAAYENSRQYLSFRVRVGRYNPRVLDMTIAGLAIAIPACLYWTSQQRAESGTTYQMDSEGVYREYRRPKGIPVGDSPYRRVVQDDLLTKPYGIRANPSTFSLEELTVKIRERFVLIKTRVGTVNGFRIGGSLVICNAHPFMSYDLSKTPIFNSRLSEIESNPFFIVCGDQSYRIEEVLNQSYRVPGRDLLVLHVPSLPPFSSKWNFPSLLCDTPPTSQSMADEAYLITPSSTRVSTTHARARKFFLDENSPPRPLIWEYNCSTSDGDCGSLLVIRRGAHYSIAGFHTGVVDEAAYGEYSYSESLSRSELDKAIEVFKPYGATYELHLDPQQLLGHDQLPDLTPLPFKSSLGASLSFPEDPLEVTVFGTCPGLGGASSKSRCVNTIFRKDPAVQQLERSLGSYPYFTAPTFTGSMEGEGDTRRWIDPHTISLENTANIGGSRSVWDKAIFDMLRGIEGKAQRMRMEPLDDYLAFFGVQDTVIGGTNMRSSAGPPFYARKSAIIRVDHTSSPKLLEWDPGFAEHLSVIEETLRKGLLYSPLCLHVLKDEVITIEKNARHKVRVFNILPFAFNHLMKRYLSPLTAFMREHALFFESVVGMNITSVVTATHLYEHLDQYPNCLAFDKSSFDARCSTEEHIAVCRFFKQLAFWCGYTPADCEMVFSLCLSAIYPVRSIKGDLFMLASSMPSGFWMTIHFNCIRSSLQARYAWFVINPDAPPFRSRVAQLVLGDDLIATVSSDCWWYNQVSIARALLEVGAKTTSCRKETQMCVYEQLSLVQFLKRTPNVVAKMYVWALDPKTLIKMLCMRLSSGDVPVLDAHAMLLTNVLAESWMWGEAFFRTMEETVTYLAMKHGLDKNVYFKNLGFQGYLRLYASGDLITWSSYLSTEQSLDPTLEVVDKQLSSLQGFADSKPSLSS